MQNRAFAVMLFFSFFFLSFSFPLSLHSSKRYVEAQANAEFSLLRLTFSRDRRETGAVYIRSRHSFIPEPSAEDVGQQANADTSTDAAAGVGRSSSAEDVLPLGFTPLSTYGPACPPFSYNTYNANDVEQVAVSQNIDGPLSTFNVPLDQSDQSMMGFQWDAFDIQLNPYTEVNFL